MIDLHPAFCRQCIEFVAFLSVAKKSEAIKLISFKNIKLDDLKQLVKLDNKIVKKYGYSYSNECWNEENFCYKLPNKDEYSFIIKKNRKILGCCIASLKDDSIYIHRFFVEQNSFNLSKIFF